MQCPKCKNILAVSAKYCDQCGSPAVKVDTTVISNLWLVGLMFFIFYNLATDFTLKAAVHSLFLTSPFVWLFVIALYDKKNQKPPKQAQRAGAAVAILLLIADAAVNWPSAWLFWQRLFK